MSDNLKLYVSETFTNDTKGYTFSKEEPYEPWTTDFKKLYNHFLKEYGAVSKMYVESRDPNQEKVEHIGYVFTKRMKYEDARTNDLEKDYYTRSVWVQFYVSCSLEDPEARRTFKNGAMTIHPYKPVTIKRLRGLIKKGAL